MAGTADADAFPAVVADSSLKVVRPGERGANSIVLARAFRTRGD